MPASVAADAVLALALVVHAELLARLRRVDAPQPPWWFDYARDATNLAAVLMAWGAFVSLGFPPAVGFLAAALTAFTTYLLDWLIAHGLRLRHARLWLALPLAAWVLAVALAPAPIGHAFARLVAAVQPTTR